MFETSSDILNIVKAVSILTFSLLSSWAVYYLARTMKELFRISKETRGMLSKVDDVVDTIKEKVEHSTSYLLLMSEGVKKIVEVIGTYTNKKSKTNNEAKEDEPRDVDED